jgi:hypothetical protein
MRGLDLNDRSLAIAQDGLLAGAEPAAFRRDESGPRAGAAAWAGARRFPTATSTRHWDEIATRRAGPAAWRAAEGELLARLGQAPGDPLWVAAPRRFDAEALAEVLGLLRGLPQPVAGFVDPAALLAAWFGLEEPVVVLDVGAWRSSASLVRPRDGAWQLRRSVVATTGLLPLLEAWLALAAEAMVSRTRFDPLYDAAHEQQLFDALLPLAREAEVHGGARQRLRFDTREVELELARDQFAGAARDPVAALAAALRDLGQSRPTVLLPDAVAALPGVRAALRDAGAGRLLRLPDGAAAIAASLLQLPVDARADSVRHLLRVAGPFAAGPPDVASDDGDAAAAASSRPAATHVLVEGRAWPIDERGLVLGRDPAGSEATLLRLPAGIAGLSRRHCSLWRRGGEAVIVDHSRFGSFVDGVPVTGRATLHAGSVLRLGTPGIDLPLIAV